MNKLSGLLAAGLLAGPMSASALMIDNITYGLNQSLVSSTATTETWAMTLSILNNSDDGRTAVTSMAFNRPSGFVSASLPGWNILAGGLNANGCSGSGNFFCFSGYAAAAPTMSFTFNLTGGVGAFASYSPGFKIDWVGSQNNYDLVSLPLPSTSVPEPGTLALFGLGLAGLGLARRKRAA